MFISPSHKHHPTSDLWPSAFPPLWQKPSGPDDHQSAGWVAQLPADCTSLSLTSSREHNYKIQFRVFFKRARRDAGGVVVTTRPALDLMHKRTGFFLQLLWGFYTFSVFFCLFLYRAFETALWWSSAVKLEQQKDGGEKQTYGVAIACGWVTCRKYL